MTPFFMLELSPCLSAVSSKMCLPNLSFKNYGSLTTTNKIFGNILYKPNGCDFSEKLETISSAKII